MLLFRSDLIHCSVLFCSVLIYRSDRLMRASVRHILNALNVLVSLRVPSSFLFILLIGTVCLDLVADVTTAIFIECSEQHY